jgi:drug/metabolite transporter (DMT)-like permease
MEDALPGLGEALAVLSAFSFAAASVCIAKSGRGSGDNGAFLSIIVTAFAAFLVWALAQTLQGADVYKYDLVGVIWFIVSGLLTIVFGRALFFKSIVYLGAIRASAVSRLNPFFSVILAAMLLGEVVTVQAGAGMVMIAFSFGILISRMLSRQQTHHAYSTEQAISLLSYSYGTASALAYALGYTARKFGLIHIPDSNLGTLIGAASGLASYLFASLFSAQYRATLKNLRLTTTRWHVLAACFVSAGQLAGFAAIKYIEVSRVAMIASVDIFISIFLSVYVLKIEKRPDMTTMAAILLASCGVALVAIR